MSDSPPDVSSVFKAAMARGGMRPAGGVGSIGLILMCLIVYLPGFFAIPPVDRDESRFAQASRQMFESVSLPESRRDAKRHGGGLVVPMVQDRPRLNKPPMIYWLQAGSAAFWSNGNPYRDSIWMYRVPSLIAAIIAVLATRRLASLIFDPAAGALAAIVLAVCPVIGWEARQARADMVLLACTTTAMLALWRAFAPVAAEAARVGSESDEPLPQAGWKNAIVFWLAVAAGILTKGPITPMVAGLTAIGVCVVSRRWRWLLSLKPVIAIPILALAIGPWVYAVAKHVGFDQYLDTIYRETIGRSTEPAEGHWGPPGYHVILMPLLFWPGCLLTGLGLIVGVRLALRRGEIPVEVEPGGRKRVVNEAAERAQRGIIPRMGHPGYLFLVAWIVPCWVIFEMVSTKLPHYTMPLYPALAVLSARALLAADMKVLPGVESKWTGAGFILWLVIGAGLVFGGVAAIAMRLIIWPAATGSAFVLIVVSMITAMLMLRGLRAGWKSIAGRHFARAGIAAAAIMVLFWLIVPAFALPKIMGLSRSIGAEVDRIDPGASRAVAAVGYHEDSLVFLTRGRLERIDANGAAAWLVAHPGGMLIRDRAAAMPEALKLAEIGAANGFNYSKGKSQRLVIEELAR